MDTFASKNAYTCLFESNRHIHDSYIEEEPIIKRRFEVIFDQSNEQLYSPLDTSYSGMSLYATAIFRQGGAISLNNEPLHLMLDKLAGPGQVLFLGVALFRGYEQCDLEAIDAFMKRGGGVLVIVEHDDFMGNATFQNMLTGKYGITALPETNTTTQDVLEPHWTWCDVPDWGLNRVQFYMPAPLISTNPAAKPFAHVIEPDIEENSIVAYRILDCDTRMIVMGDAEILWNGDSHLGFNIGENQFFLEKITTELAGVPHLTEPWDQPSIISASDVARRKVLFVRDGYSIVPDNATLGMGRLIEKLAQDDFSIDIAYINEVQIESYQVIFVINPMKKLAEDSIEALGRAKRIVVAVDGQSNLFANPNFINLFKIVLDKDINYKTFLPANDILSSQQIEFEDAFIAGTNPKNHLMAGVLFFDDTTLTLFRSCLIAIKGEENSVTTFAKTVQDSRKFRSITPYQEGDIEISPFFEENNQFGTGIFPVLVESGNILAMANLSMLSDYILNSNAGDRLYNIIVQKCHSFVACP